MPVGVPQGSKSGPVLFLVYATDVADCLLASDIVSARLPIKASKGAVWENITCSTCLLDSAHAKRNGWLSVEVNCHYWPIIRYTRSWYTGMRYWKQCLKAPLLRLSPTPSRFSRKFSRSAFLTILELGKGYKCCSSLYVSVYIHVACGSCVICKRRGRHLSGLYFYISVGTHNNVIKRRTWSVVFAAVLAIRKCFWLWISKTGVFYRETWTKWNISFKIGAKIELKVFFSAVSQFHLWVYFCPLCVHIGSMFRFGSLLLTQLA